MKPGVRLGLFLVGATFFNLAATAIGFIAAFWLYANTIGRSLGSGAAVWGIGGSFAAGLGFSVLAYRFLIKILRRKCNLDQWLSPGRPRV